MKTIIKIVIAFVSIIVIDVLVTSVAVGNETQIEALNQQQMEMERRKKETQLKLDNTVMAQNKVLADLKLFNDNIDTVEKDIVRLTKDIDQTITAIDAAVVEIDNKQRDYEGRVMIFSVRLKEMYQYGEVNFLEVLLQSTDLTDFLTRFEYLKYIAVNDQKLLEDVVVLKTALETEKNNLELQKHHLEDKRQNQQTKSQELEIATANKEALLKQLDAEKDSMFDALDAIEEESNKLVRQIKSLQSSGGVAPNPSEFTWPCPSSKEVTSVYGPRNHPVKKKPSFHTGVDISAKYGQDIVSAANGQVIAVSYNSAYGNYIVVDHGGGLSTMYAHMSDSVVVTGEQVVAGKTIGKIGSTGISTGPHVHFEVRINGAHTKPDKYIGL